MPRYEIRDKKDGRVVYRYEYDAPIDWKQFPARDFDTAEIPVVVEPVDPIVQAAAVLLTVEERDQLVATLKRATALLEAAEVSEKPKSEVDQVDPARKR